MGLISVADLDARGVEYATTDQADAAIEDASAVARDYVSPVLDDVERGDTPDTPGVVVAVVVGMVRRVLTNPSGWQSATLGDLTFAAGTNAVATMLPTQREKRMLRRAAATFAKAAGVDVPSWGTGAAYQSSEIPAPPFFFDGIQLPGDDDI
jgi:hypothetical protein